MTDRPILFSGPMIRALLDGRKTTTRRILKRDRFFENGWPIYIDGKKAGMSFKKTPDIEQTPYAIGDRLYVRETGHCYHQDENRAVYRADYDDGNKPCRVRKQIETYEVGRWTPGIHMPRWASRLTLIVTDVKVERLQDISEADARAEGVEHRMGAMPEYRGGESLPWRSEFPRDAFHDLWDSLNGNRKDKAGNRLPYAWADNPWIVAPVFTVHKANIDQMGDA